MFRNRDFRYWILGTTADSLGASLMLIVVPLAAVSVSGSTITAGAIGTAHAATIACLLLVGGLLVDRMNRRTGMLINAAVRFAALGVCGVLAFTGELTVMSLLICVMAAAVSQGLFGSADNAALRSIVDDASVVRAQPIVQTRKALVELIGAPLGGILIGVSMGLPFLVAAVLAGVLALSAMAIRANLHPAPQQGLDSNGADESNAGAPQHRDSSADRRGKRAWREFTKGIELVFRDSALRTISFLVVFVNLATGLVLNATVLHYAAENTEPQKISLLFLCATVGMLIGALVSGRLISRFASGKLLVAAFLWFAAAYIAAAVYPTFVMMCVCLALIGFAAPIVSSIAQGYVIVKTPANLQGRVGSLLTLFSMGMASLAPLIAGVAVSVWTASYAYWFAVAISLSCVAAVLIGRGVRRLGKPSEWATSGS